MAGKTVSFHTLCNLSESQAESVARWLSCNGEVWGMGPTAVFASAAALFLFHELQATVFTPGDHAHVSPLEKTLVFSMVVGMLALMIHLWVCSMRFFQYYLDTLIRDSPNILLEMTTAGFLGKSELVPLGPLTRFLKQQQPQIHITICWFLSLCYADYVRKHYCTRFNMPYLEQWQAELHARASRGVHHTMQRVNSFVGAVHHRLRGYTHSPTPSTDADTHTSGAPSVEVSGAGSRVSFAAGARAASEPSVGRALRGELGARLIGAAGATSAEILDNLRAYVTLLEWARCGESCLSAIPTLLWAAGAAAFAHRVVSALFKRFMFRRVPLWEIILQHLIFIWMIIYSLHLWTLIVKIIKVMVDYYYNDEQDVVFTREQITERKMMQQWLAWLCGAAPLALYLHTRPRPAPPPLMIWITTNPWQRREMGPYGYYLHRPPSLAGPSTSVKQQAVALRRAYSDSTTIVKELPRRRRISKSV